MAKTVNPTELAQAIAEGKSLVEIAKQAECTSLTVARVLYGHYAHATIPDGLTGQALRHYMALRHDAVRLCQKAGVGPLREEDTELPQLRKEVRATLSQASLAADMKAGRSIIEMARRRNVTERTVRGYLHRHGLLGDGVQDTADYVDLLDATAGGTPMAAASPSEAAPTFPPTWGEIRVPDSAATSGKPVTRTFSAHVSEEGIDIALSDDGLTPAQVRQYLSVAEANLELAGEGLELHLSIRGPRR